MSDFVSGFWSIYVAGLTTLSILGCAWLLYVNTVKRTAGPVELHDHIWDENLQEYNHPLPRWWMWLFYITIVFALVYLAFYPGFGSAKGMWGWSSKDGPGSQYAKEMADAKAKYDPIFNKYAGMDLTVVAADPDAKAMGQRLFLTYCASCHQSDARGAKGFPNLTDSDWMYGGQPDQIKTTVAGGRNGVMPPFGEALGADGVKNVANYVRSLSGLAADPARVQKGKDIFQENCVACHGPDGKGNQDIGAPNLTDKTWLYGDKEAEIIKGVTNGRNNLMPAWGELLGPAKVHLLAAYVYGLGGGQKPAPVSAAVPPAVPSAATPSAAPAAAKLYFDSGKAELPGDSQAILKSIIDFASAHAEAKLAISGFHDATGDKVVNEELAKNRAKAVRDALKSAGISEDRVELRKPQETTGAGDDKEARRVEVSIL
jgi:cytochrome c oxidase cbb3-type subunit III